VRITASLVLFHSDPDMYSRAILSFLQGCNGVLYVVDNSAVPLRHELFDHSRVRYHFTGRNLGFGAGHNFALKEMLYSSDLHLVLNPDVSFGTEVLEYLAKRMIEAVDIGLQMPKIVYPNGKPQWLHKLLPSPMDLIFRRFIAVSSLRKRINKRYELHLLRQDQPTDIPSLSGCFLLIRTSLLQQIGGFDERYFMYMEDVDLVRRIGDIARTVYDPSVVVVHAYSKGSYFNKKLLGYHTISAIKYFNKWGWFHDSVRRQRNKEVKVYLVKTHI
jgi:GT2 family glycosyltransferase